MYSPRRPKTPPQETRPLQPSVTLEQVLAYRPDQPETATPSALMNQILAAWFAVRPLSTQALGHYLAIDGRKLLPAVELLTGIPYPQLRELWAKHHAARLEAENPSLTKDEIARAVGYSDYSALWRTAHREKRRQEYRQRRQLIDLARQNWWKTGGESGTTNGTNEI